MLSTKNTQIITYLLLLAIWLYTFYVSVITPPFFSYFTVDENFVADSGVFLWYGMTPRCLDWPATPSVLIFFLIYGIDVLIVLISNLGSYDSLIEVFETFDYTAYQYLIDRERYILIARAVQLVIIGFFVFLSVRFIYRQNHPLLTPAVQILLSALIISSNIVWMNAPVLRPEAISGCIFLYILVQLIFSTDFSVHRVRILSALFAVVIAERLLFLFVSPIFYLSLFFLLPNQDRWRVTLNSIATTLLVFVALCPFLITDPLVVAKSFVGGIIAKMNDKPMQTLFNQDYIGSYFDNPISYFIIILSLVGTYVLLSQKKIQYWVLIANWLLFLFLVLRSAKIYDTHVLPAGVITLVVAGIGFGYLSEFNRSVGRVVSVVFIIYISFANFGRYTDFQAQSHRNENVHSTYNWIQTLPSGTKLLALVDLNFYLNKSDKAIIRVQEQISDTTLMANKLNYLLGNESNKVGFSKLSVIAKTFLFEDERLATLQNQILMKYSNNDKVNKYDVDFYLENVNLANQFVEWKKALNDFKTGNYQYLVSDLDIEGYTPVKVFDQDEGKVLKVYKSLQ